VAALVLQACWSKHDAPLLTGDVVCVARDSVLGRAVKDGSVVDRGDVRGTCSSSSYRCVYRLHCSD
jgi:hypothetical protein